MHQRRWIAREERPVRMKLTYSNLEWTISQAMSWKFLSLEKGEYDGEHGYGIRTKSRRWKCAYQNLDVCQK